MSWPFDQKSDATLHEIYSWAAAPEHMKKWQEEFEALADCLTHTHMFPPMLARFNTKTGRVEIHTDTLVMAEIIEVKTSQSKPDEMTIRCRREASRAIELFRFEGASRTVIANL